jgi:hypothetical protein
MESNGNDLRVLVVLEADKIVVTMPHKLLDQLPQAS